MCIYIYLHISTYMYIYTLYHVVHLLALNSMFDLESSEAAKAKTKASKASEEALKSRDDAEAPWIMDGLLWIIHHHYNMDY